MKIIGVGVDIVDNTRIKKLIRKLAIPAVVGTLFQTLYNVVDTFFAGKISPEAIKIIVGKGN